MIWFLMVVWWLLLGQGVAMWDASARRTARMDPQSWGVWASWVVAGPLVMPVLTGWTLGTWWWEVGRLTRESRRREKTRGLR